MNEIFKQNPQLQVVFVTSDGTPFYNDGDAKNHAKTLDDKKVETVYNPNHLQVVDSEEVTNEAVEMEQFKAKEKAEAKLKAEKEAKKPIDLSKLSKAKLLEFAQENKLTVSEPTATNKVIVAELEEQLKAKA